MKLIRCIIRPERLGEVRDAPFRGALYLLTREIVMPVTPGALDLTMR